MQTSGLTFDLLQYFKYFKFMYTFTYNMDLFPFDCCHEDWDSGYECVEFSQVHAM